MARLATRKLNKALPGSAAEAQTLYDSGEYSEALAQLSGITDSPLNDPRVDLLRARCLLRLERPADAEKLLLPLCDPDVPANLRIVALSLAAVALRASKSAARAADRFSEAAQLLEKAAPDSRAEYAYHRAVALWEDGDIHAAAELVESTLEVTQGELRPMLVQMLGWIEVRNERYAVAAQRFIEALELLALQKHQNQRLRATLVHVVAVIASETMDLRLGRRLEAFFEEMRWSEGDQRERFQTLTARLFLTLLRGDLKTAWQLSREALTVAPSPPFAAMAATNAAMISAHVGDSFEARRQLEVAWGAIESVSWSQADDEERIALIHFSIEGATTMPAEARSAATLYTNITGALDSRLALHGDRRIQAFELMAAGRIAEAIDKPGQAIIKYKASRDIWSALDYRMRAALVSLDLVRLTNDITAKKDVARALVRAPKAWFAPQESANAAEGTPLEALTKAERNLLRQLLGGGDVRSIAEELGRSKFTIHNQTRGIFRKFQVNHRAGLIAACAAKGITPDSLR